MSAPHYLADNVVSKYRNLKDICDISEIAESIFVHCSIYDLVRISKVCRQWREIVCTSPALRANLFLNPSNSAKGFLKIGKDENTIESARPPMLLRGEGVIPDGARYSAYYCITTLHPALSSGWQVGRWNDSLLGIDITLDADDISRWARSGSRIDWPQMLIARPAPVHVKYHVGYDYKDPKDFRKIPNLGHVVGEAENTDGVTLGNLEESFRLLTGNLPQFRGVDKASIVVRWTAHLLYFIDDEDEDVLTAENRSMHSKRL